MYYDDTDIVLVTRADVGEVGGPMALLVWHQPIRRPRGALRGQGGASVQPLGGALGGEVVPSGEGSSSIAIDTVV